MHPITIMPYAFGASRIECLTTGNQIEALAVTVPHRRCSFVEAPLERTARDSPVLFLPLPNVQHRLKHVSLANQERFDPCRSAPAPVWVERSARCIPLTENSISYFLRSDPNAFALLPSPDSYQNAHAGPIHCVLPSSRTSTFSLIAIAGATIQMARYYSLYAPSIPCSLGRSTGLP